MRLYAVVDGDDLGVAIPPNGDEWPTRTLSFAVDRWWWAMLVLTRLRG